MQKPTHMGPPRDEENRCDCGFQDPPSPPSPLCRGKLDIGSYGLKSVQRCAQTLLSLNNMYATDPNKAQFRGCSMPGGVGGKPQTFSNKSAHNVLF